MGKLKLLYIHNLRLALGPNCLPNALRFLNWSWYPSKSLPPSFQPDELTELSLPHSNIRHLWNGMKCLVKLKSIDLSYSINLTMTPDFTGIPNLERYCRSIKSLPSEVKMEYLETLDVSFIFAEAPSFRFFCCVLPGSEMFEWFSNQSLGDTVTEKRPPYSSNSKWIGFAVCALFAAHDNPSAVPEDRDLHPFQGVITCSFDGHEFFGPPVKQIGSDHLLLSIFSARYCKPENCPDDNLTKFVFYTYRGVGNNRCLKIKKCFFKSVNTF
ncbi:hypothetical protein ACLB2K_069751 [Fragaria x ananassa]